MDTHTKKEIAPTGLYSDPPATEDRQAGGSSLVGYLAASCGFTDSHLWSSESVEGNGDPQLERSNTTHHGGTRTHKPESNERSQDPTNDPASHERRPGEPSRPEARNDLQGTKEQHPRIQLAILLIPPPCGVEGSALA